MDNMSRTLQEQLEYEKENRMETISETEILQLKVDWQSRLIEDSTKQIAQLQAELEIGKASQVGLDKCISHKKRKARAEAELEDSRKTETWAVKQTEIAEQERDRLRELFKLHNLLPFIAKGKCRCDPDVGAVPCESCAASEILKQALKGEQNE